MSAPFALRFALDDVKAYYLEAGLAGPAQPSSRQLGDWLWNETAAGKAIFALRRANLDAADDRLKLIAGNFMVPGGAGVGGGLRPRADAVSGGPAGVSRAPVSVP